MRRDLEGPRRFPSWWRRQVVLERTAILLFVFKVGFDSFAQFEGEPGGDGVADLLVLAADGRSVKFVPVREALDTCALPHGEDAGSNWIPDARVLGSERSRHGPAYVAR